MTDWISKAVRRAEPALASALMAAAMLGGCGAPGEALSGTLERAVGTGDPRPFDVVGLDLEAARGTRFPRPSGGEAEFSWGFGMDPSEDVRPPLNWEASSLSGQEGDLVAAGRRCGGGGPYTITAYIAPEGAVVAAGGTTPDAESEQTLDCILEAVREMTMPDPGSYPAKVTFEVR